MKDNKNISVDVTGGLGFAMFILAILLLLVWIELAVGIFGTPLAGS